MSIHITDSNVKKTQKNVRNSVISYYIERRFDIDAFARGCDLFEDLSFLKKGSKIFQIHLLKKTGIPMSPLSDSFCFNLQFK